MIFRQQTYDISNQRCCSRNLEQKILEEQKEKQEQLQKQRHNKRKSEEISIKEKQLNEKE